MTNYRNFISATENGPPADIFAELDALVQMDVGAIIFSCSTFDRTTQKAKRVYTNQPDAYPVSGLKEIVPNRWTEHVLEQGKTFVANTLTEIAEVFADHQLISQLGCGSAVNVPIRLCGSILGTMNLLNTDGYYTTERVSRTLDLRPAATIAFMALR